MAVTSQPVASVLHSISLKNFDSSAIGKHLVVKYDGSNEYGCALPGAETDALVGVTTEAIAAGSYGNIQTHGASICTAGAAITAGALLECTTAGKVQAWSASGGSNSSPVGIALQTAGADGDLISVLLSGPGASKQG